MPVIQTKPEPFYSNQGDTQKWWAGSPTPKSPEAAVVELSIALANAESTAPIPGLCSRCRGWRAPRTSTAEYASVFCSEQCEKDFIRAALANLTLDDCVRIHQRLETLIPA